jgi:hypothetical protein
MVHLNPPIAEKRRGSALSRLFRSGVGTPEREKLGSAMMKRFGSFGKGGRSGSAGRCGKKPEKKRNSPEWTHH